MKKKRTVLLLRLVCKKRNVVSVVLFRSVLLVEMGVFFTIYVKIIYKCLSCIILFALHNFFGSYIV